MLQLFGVSPAILAIHREIEVLAQTRDPVLVVGEPGTGKQLVARMIHERSDRHERPFAMAACSGIPEMLFESELFGHVAGSFPGAYRNKPALIRFADRGTLFLEELGAISLRQQSLVLRFLESGEFAPIGRESNNEHSSARLIAATCCDLEKQLVSEQFCEGLLQVFRPIFVPPLRHRRTDVLLLFAHFLEDSSVRNQTPVPELTATLVATLQSYPWPGNVRELKRLAERLVAQRASRPVDVSDLPYEIRQVRNPDPSIGRP
ncbi:MAG: sigma-54-dependent Fis family transcriptional regulator [Blastocatellia bacterium]|nr:MAG: sigma-54-dependent Fis family transcriptional regulator [Blastocatellia bacterium]